MSKDPISDKELIDKFLRNELTEKEQFLFDSRKKEEAFLVLLEETVISYQGRLALKEKLKHIGDELNVERKKSYQKPLAWFSGIAASLLLYFAFQFFNSPTLSSDELFDSYFEAYPNLHATKGGSDNHPMVKKAFQFYDKAQYEQAVNAFKKIATVRTLNSSEYFYSGISLLALNHTEDSKASLKKVNKQHPLHTEAQWYISLALIKQDSLSKAKTILNDKNLNFSTYRSDKAKKLLNQIK